jgi:hypothetical protein
MIDERPGSAISRSRLDAINRYSWFDLDLSRRIDFDQQMAA